MKMKVAIIGAGISGLTCALGLEKLGVSCEIYERKHRIGNLFSFGEIILQVMHRPHKDPLNFLKSQLGMSIEPLNEIKKVVIKSPKKEIKVEGKLGYIFERGQGEKSLENQLAKEVQSKILFNTNADYKKLSKIYDYVVIATGNDMIVKQLTQCENIVSSRIKGGIALGDFDPHTVYVWFNRLYARSGFAYLVPVGNNKATITLVSTYTLKEEIEDMWQTFLYHEKLNYRMIETFETEVGSCLAKNHKIDNIYVIGNAGGFLEPAFGFGLVNSIKTALYCATSIVKGEDYEEKVKGIITEIQKMVDLRRAMDEMTNEDYDRILSIIGNPIVKNLIYKTNVEVIKYIPFLTRIIKKPS